MEEFVVGTPQELMIVLPEVLARMGKDTWWRGHAQEPWPLLPGAFRPNVGDSEKHFAARFVQKAPSRYLHCPTFNDFSSWLFLMQHHGLPTRLLDWSESPLAALFFAVREHSSVDACLWVLNPFKLNSPFDLTAVRLRIC
jgi:hypothetical protein